MIKENKYNLQELKKTKLQRAKIYFKFFYAWKWNNNSCTIVNQLISTLSIDQYMYV